VLCGAEIWDCAMIKGGIWVADAQVLIHWLPRYRPIFCCQGPSHLKSVHRDSYSVGAG
jgi:hypothetical protein